MTFQRGWLAVRRRPGDHFAVIFRVGVRSVFSLHLSPGYFWVRLFGRGIHVKRADLPLLFSERSGAWPSVRLGPVRVKWL